MPVKEDNNYDLKGLPEDKKWLLSIGSYIPYAAGRAQVVMPGFALTRIATDEAIDFRANNWRGLITRTQGLASPESWGTWSSADEVVLAFSRPLPNAFNIRLTAHAFGPNIGKDFILRVGNDAVRFKLAEQDQEQLLQIDNPEAASTISIDIPQATSPAQLGIGLDNRKLGIGLQTLLIEPRN